MANENDKTEITAANDGVIDLVKEFVTEPIRPDVRARKVLLPTVALVSLLGIIGIAAYAWHSPSSDPALTGGVVTFLQSVVMTVLGFYVGSQMPEQK